MWVKMTMVMDVRIWEGYMPGQIVSLPPRTHCPESLKIHAHTYLSTQPKKDEFDVEPYQNSWNHMDLVLEGCNDRFGIRCITQRGYMDDNGECTIEHYNRETAHESIKSIQYSFCSWCMEHAESTIQLGLLTIVGVIFSSLFKICPESSSMHSQHVQAS